MTDKAVSSRSNNIVASAQILLVMIQIATNFQYEEHLLRPHCHVQRSIDTGLRSSEPAFREREITSNFSRDSLTRCSRPSNET